MTPGEAADSPQAVLSFWFAPECAAHWFAASDGFDAAVERTLGPPMRAALAGGLAEWRRSAEGRRALVLLLDQATRNLYRGRAAAFAGDEAALALTRQALACGDDLGLAKAERVFLYMPLEHSERLVDQFLSEALIASLGDDNWTLYAARHREIIERFGRFPHRNEALGRLTTPLEKAILAEPMSSF